MHVNNKNLILMYNEDQSPTIDVRLGGTLVNLAGRMGMNMIAHHCSVC